MYSVNEIISGMLIDLSNDDMVNDIIKFERGNGAAGTRIRKRLQDIIDEIKALRKEIQKIKNKRKN